MKLQLKKICERCQIRWLPSLVFASVAASAQGQNGPPPAPVVVQTAEIHSLAPVTWYPGTTISRNRARLAAEVAGRVVSVAEVGARLEAGEPAARLDDSLLKQTLARNQAAVAREEARLVFLNAEVKRFRRLVVQNTATKSRLEEAVANLGVARSELAANQARVRLTRERLKRTVLKAPFSGVVVERLLEPGEWADEGSAILRLVDTLELDVQAWVPVQALKFLSNKSELRLKANPSETTGRVHTIVPVGDGLSRLYELRIAVPEVEWPVGQDVRVAVPSATPRDVVAVHRDALVLRRDGTVVYRVNEENVAERVEVETGIASGDLIEVSGINSGDRVVTRGGERLRPGQKVMVLTPDGAP
jgi:RND family efflux transporter MFP subunit